MSKGCAEIEDWGISVHFVSGDLGKFHFGKSRQALETSDK